MHHILIDARIISSTTGRYVERLLHYIEQLDTENRYTVLVRKKDLGYWRPTNPNFTLCEAEFDNYSLGEQTGLLRLLNEINPDLVHFCQPHQPVLYQGAKISTIHDLTLLKTYNSDKNWLVYHVKQLIGRFVFRSVIKRSSYVITPTDFTKQEIVKRYHTAPAKIVTTHLAAETKTTDQKPYPLPSGEFIMYVGQQSDYKNVRRLGDAHQQLLKTHPKLQLVLVGKIDAAAKRNQEYFKEQRYENIVFTGFVDDDELNWLYANTRAYVFPSLMEGFGLPGLEAMLHGAPVASSNATCLPEVYGEAAHYFDPLSVTDMTRAIDELLSDGQLRARLIKIGYEQVKKYSWKKTAEETLAVYEKVLGTMNSSERL